MPAAGTASHSASAAEYGALCELDRCFSQFQLELTKKIPFIIFHLIIRIKLITDAGILITTNLTTLNAIITGHNGR